MRGLYEKSYGDLPDYLTQVNLPKNERVTMDVLKAKHEKKSMIKAVAGCTIASFVLRQVSFDAFLILLLALNCGACYIVRHRHELAKSFVKNSIKRRVNFTKQVWNARW